MINQSTENRQHQFALQPMEYTEKTIRLVFSKQQYLFYSRKGLFHMKVI